MLAPSNTIWAIGKHAKVKTSHLRELVRNNLIKLLYVESRNNVADLQAKILVLYKIQHFIKLMSMSNEKKVALAIKICYNYFTCDKTLLESI